MTFAGAKFIYFAQRWSLFSHQPADSHLKALGQHHPWNLRLSFKEGQLFNFYQAFREKKYAEGYVGVDVGER